MTLTQLRTVLGALAAIAGLVAACSRNHAKDEVVIGPRLGESTASGPDNPSVPPPDAAGVRETQSGPITGLGRAPAQPTPSGGASSTPSAPAPSPVTPSSPPLAAPAGAPPAGGGGGGEPSPAQPGPSPLLQTPGSMPDPMATDAGVPRVTGDAPVVRILDAGGFPDAGHVLDGGPAR